MVLRSIVYWHYICSLGITITIWNIKEWRQFELAEDVWLFGFFAFNTIKILEIFSKLFHLKYYLRNGLVIPPPETTLRRTWKTWRATWPPFSTWLSSSQRWSRFSVILYFFLPICISFFHFFSIILLNLFRVNFTINLSFLYAFVKSVFTFLIFANWPT